MARPGSKRTSTSLPRTRSLMSFEYSLRFGGFRRLSAFLDDASGLFGQDFEFRFRFRVEQKYPGTAVLPADAVVQRFSNFLATFPYPRKNNAVPGNANALQEPQLAARDDVEAAA